LSAAAIAACVALAGCQAAEPPAESPTTAPLPSYTVVDEPGGVAGCVHDGDTVLTLGDDPLPRSESRASGEGESAVFLAHPAGQRPCAWNEYGRELAARGMQVFIPSLTGTPDALIGAAVVWLTEHGVERYALVGASMGGTYVLAATPALTPAPSLVVAISAPTEYAGADALSAISEIDAPVLLMAGNGDGDFPAQARELADAQPNAELLVATSNAHGIELRANNAPVAERLDTALADALG
jgi:pimeloyl-ACP methyl ester carboxylesterase